MKFLYDSHTPLILDSFVGTYMEREADALIVENISKKYVPSPASSFTAYPQPLPRPISRIGV